MKKWLLGAGLAAMSFATQAARDPEAIYNRSCGACHAGQLPMAPRKGDKIAWQPRLAKGMDALARSVTAGLNAMPPRGLCMDCSVEDYKATIQWMSQ